MAIQLDPLRTTLSFCIQSCHRRLDWESLQKRLLDYHRKHYPRSVTYMPKTKRPRKVHFVWADTNDVKCEVRQDGNTLYSKWAPDVTCAICRQMMVNRGVTRIL